MMTRTGVTLTVVSALAFIIGIAVWAWHVLVPADAEGLKPQFSFAQLLNVATRSEKPSGEMPTRIDERMPESPPEMSPPVLRTQGDFNSIQESRAASGSARLYVLGTGEQLLRLENFSITRAPDLHLYLTGAQAPRSPEAVLRDFIDLGELKAQSGEYNYLIPGDVDISEYHGVVVFSPLFRELYAVATMVDAPRATP